MRYRIGDMYLCMSAGSKTEPPRFTYVDRVPNVIDIAGFTRITEKSIHQAVELSRLPIENWTAKKEFSDNNRPYLHLYVELQRNNLINCAVSIRILQDQLGIYFRYLDQDYEDLKKILGVDLPDDMVEKIVDGVNAKLTADKLSDGLGALKKLFTP